MRKEVKLSEDTVKKLKAKADKDNRKLKPYMELFLDALANDKVVMLK